MKPILSIKPHPGLRAELAIHPKKADEIGMGQRKFTAISFGSQSCYIAIKRDPALAMDDILLSRNLIKELHLPLYPEYEIVRRQNGLSIGPYIGLLLSLEDKRLTTSRLDKALLYVKAYAKLHGAILLFALDKVDRERRLIEGYCYNPVKRYWEKGVYPYPASIYRTVGLNPQWKNHFLSVIGDKIFNSRFFNKWEMYQWLSKEPRIRPYIPDTVLYRSPDDILTMLESYQAIYIKPILGLQGRGIVRIHREDEKLSLKYRENGINRNLAFEDEGTAYDYMRKRFRHGRYLIQQAVNLLEYRGGLIDFRCVHQKSQANAWECKAVIGRCGVKESIVSNISSGGTAFTAESILRKALTCSAEGIEALKNEIVDFTMMVADKLDDYGINCGTLGFDVGLEPSGRLWLIEINNRDPDPGIALDIHNTQLYYALKTGPLFYAKYLAGFAAE